MACRKSCIQQMNYNKSSYWDRSEALARFEPISSNRYCTSCTTSKRHEICSRHQQSHSNHHHHHSSNKRRHTSSSRHSNTSSGQKPVGHRHHQHSRHYAMNRVASARQSSFSVLSKSSAAVLSDQQRRQRVTNKSDEIELHNLINACAKIGRRSVVQPDRKSLRRSAVIEEQSGSEPHSSTHVSDPSRQEISSNRSRSNSSKTTDTDMISPIDNSEQKLDLMPLLSGSVSQQSRMGLFWPEKKRFLVLRQTCLEIYANESDYNKGLAKSCILLVGAKLHNLDGNKFRIAYCSRSKLFRFGTDDEHRRWTEEIERTISQLSLKA